MVAPVAPTSRPERRLSSEQRARERAIELALAMDTALIATLVVVAAVAGSVTMFAEVIRTVLMLLIEIFALVVMKRIHRGRTAAFEFGSGKLEQLVNLLIAAGMLVGAVWILFGVVNTFTRVDEAGTPAGFAMAALVTAVNCYINVLAWDAMRRAASAGGSLIMQGQLEARVVKLVSSALVLVSMTIAALSADAVVIVWSDSIGALVVCTVIIYTAVGMLRVGVPDLVDRSVNDDVHAAINRTLARHFDDYDRLEHVRTRRAGHLLHAEISLGFRADLSMGEVDARVNALKASLRDELGDADISILTLSC